MSLEDLHLVVNELGIDYWVMGGYAVELAVGRLTRAHADVDVLVRMKDLGKLITKLESKGYIVDYKRDKVIATNNGSKIDIITLEENKQFYVIPVFNAELRVPKKLMSLTESVFDGKIFSRVPNEVLYLLTRYSPFESDVLIAENLRVNPDLLNKIKIRLKRRS